jgi:hypothetical protein
MTKIVPSTYHSLGNEVVGAVGARSGTIPAVGNMSVVTTVDRDVNNTLVVATKSKMLTYRMVDSITQRSRRIALSSAVVVFDFE